MGWEEALGFPYAERATAFVDTSKPARQPEPSHDDS